MKRQQLARREGRANLGNGKVVIELSRKRDNSICGYKKRWRIT